MLQILEEGELSDSFGHNVSFKNTVIIMTSNAGAREIVSQGKIGFTDAEEKADELDYEEIKASAVMELKKIMSPELINRIDDLIVFGGLSQEEIGQILEVQLNELNDILVEKGLKMTVKPKAKQYMIENGYDPEMGARPMRRMLQREVEDPLSILVLRKDIEASDEIIVDSDGQSIEVKFKKPKKTAKKIVVKQLSE